LNEDYFTDFENEIELKSSLYKYVFLVGDTNGRTGRLKDFTQTDNYLNEYLQIDAEAQAYLNKHALLENLPIPLERCSQDQRTNTHGIRLIELCRNNNLFILNGRLFKDRHLGSFTFRDKSTIDYVIASAECFEFITEFEITVTDSLFSDGHSGLSFQIQITKPAVETDDRTQKPIRPLWKSDLQNSFVNNLDQDEINSLITLLQTSPSQPDTITRVTEDLASVFTNAADLTFPKPKTHTTHFSANAQS